MSIQAKQKRTVLFVVLGGIFLTNALLAEIIGVKIFSLEASLGLPPAQLPLFGSEFSFNLTAGVLIWPVVFILTDVINEYYGVRGVKQISYLTVILISYAFVIIWIATSVVPADFYASQDEAYKSIFRQGMNIIIGSLVAFLVGQILDAYVFRALRKVTGSKKVWLRATGSTLVSQLIDSFVVLFLAFYFLAKEPWTFSQVMTVATGNYIYKFVVAVVLTPVLYLVHNLIDRYLGKENAEKMAEEAMN